MPALGKILIIDDNEDVLFALHLLLEPYAEKVKVMRSPDRIVHFITDFRPDIVLLDMNFTRDTVSGQEGMDCLQEILKLDRHAVVVMMTAYADTDKAVRPSRPELRTSCRSLGKTTSCWPRSTPP